MKPLKTLLIDDEQHCIRTLSWELEQIDDVEIIATTNSPAEGIELIKKHKPDLVMLDIEMPEMSGFDLLERLDEMSFDLIFTTAYDEFAIKAFEANASSYLLKPIGEEKLRAAIEQVRKRSSNFESERLQSILSAIRKDLKQNRKIALPMSDGMELISSDAIIYCKSDSNYTNLFLTSGKKLLVSKTLKEIESTLSEFNFLRVHKSYLINPIHISKYVRSGGGYLIMDNEHEVSISKTKKDEVLQLFSQL